MPSRPFDVTLKDLVEDYLTAWPAVLGPWPAQQVTLVDADVSTLTAAADKVLRCEGPAAPWLLHLEPQSDHDLGLPLRGFLYATLLYHRHRLPVRTVFLLLRREANASNLTGAYQLQHPDDAAPYLIFRYHVVRVWELALPPLLAGPVGALPLAPLTDAAATDLPAVVERIDQRLRQEMAPAAAEKMRASMFMLMGLRYPEEVTRPLYERLLTMIDLSKSSSFQLILKQGRAEGALASAKQILLLQGRKRFGEPDAPTAAAVEALQDPEQVKALAGRLLDVASWQELLAPPSA
jgi:predicted transposase YdaD